MYELKVDKGDLSPATAEELAEATASGHFLTIRRLADSVNLYKCVSAGDPPRDGIPVKGFREPVVAIPRSPAEIGRDLQLLALGRVGRDLTAYGIEFNIDPLGFVFGSSGGSLAGDHALAKFVGRVTPLCEIVAAIKGDEGFVVRAEGIIRIVRCARQSRLR